MSVRAPATYATRTILWSCDRFGGKIAQIPLRVPVDGTLETNEDAAIYRTLQLAVNDPAQFTPYRDFVMPEVTLIHPDETRTTRTGEVFLVTSLTETTTSGRASGAIACEDLTTLLARSSPGAITIDPGTDTGGAARDLALGAGLSPLQLAIPDTGILLATDMTPDPGASRLKIMTALLNASNWYAPWMDAGGVIVSRSWGTLETSPVARKFGVDHGLVLMPPIQREPEWSTLQNAVTVRNIAPDRDPIWATARITNPAHPLYFDPANPNVGVGYELGGTPIDDPNLPDAATALARAQSILSDRASLLSRLRVRSLVDLDADTHEVVAIDGTGRVSPYNGEWRRRAWTTRLRGVTATTESDLRRVEQVA